MNRPTSVAGVPSQFMRTGSNSAALFSNSGSNGTVFWIMPITVPSLGATV